VIGLTEVARHGGRMVFFSCGENHHDLALLEIGAQARSPEDRQVGLYHLAFKVGDSLDGFVLLPTQKMTVRFFNPARCSGNGTLFACIEDTAVKFCFLTSLKPAQRG